ncbi:hypothetical protein CXB51_029202 [Gossypium anomalum]|uniref:Integrase catalytic domain-containing protein n=1 Tax=Gossypium anomalum TaxID=47600 RepID=A0A8J6CLJ3_9ROSI|nr:hypothetical protein CXB51_029202 [Gossypium anomalum]
MGNDSTSKTIGVGTVQLKNHEGSIKVLTDIRYVPSLKKNLISLGALESKGLTITLRDGLLKVVTGQLMVMKGTRGNNLYFLNGSTVIGSTSTVSTKDVDSEATRLWHIRLGHAGEKVLQTLAKQGLLKGANSCKLEFCEHCVLSKHMRVKFGPSIHNTKGILDYVHGNVWGPTKVASLGDNGTKYKNDPFLQVCQYEGIVRHFTVRDTPQQNGVVECMNQTILEKVRCMLSNAGLGKKFWAEAVTYACHLINRLLSAAINGKIPIEMWTGKSATDYDSLHVFGSTVYYHVKESKLDPKAKKSLFLGITDGVKGYRLWCPDTRKIVFSRDVTFDESTMLKYKDSQKDDKTSSTLQQVELEKQQDSIAYRRPRREICKPARFDDIVAYALPIEDNDVPSTYTEAISNPDGVKWKQAINEEMQSLHKNKTWELVTLPKGKKAIGCKWVYAKKEGFPVVKHSSIQILLTLVAQYDLELVQLNVKTAFLHGNLEEEIYMTQPDGFNVAGKENWVYKLTKLLYGLKQSPRQWYKRFDQFMKGQRYTRSKFDHCVYFQKLQEGTFIYLLLYVDDMLIASKSKVEIEILKTQLNLEFEMKDLGEAKKILAMEI